MNDTRKKYIAVKVIIVIRPMVIFFPDEGGIIMLLMTPMAIKTTEAIPLKRNRRKEFIREIVRFSSLFCPFDFLNTRWKEEMKEKKNISATKKEMNASVSLALGLINANQTM
jgi:hypothetical protein